MTATAVRSLVLVLALLAPAALAMETPAETPEEVRAKAEALLTQMAKKAVRGEPGGEEGIEEVRRLYRSIGDRQGEARALVVRSLAAIERSDYQPAITDLEAAIGILDAVGDRVSAALFLWVLAVAERADARFEPALAHLQRSADLLTGVVADPRGASFREVLSLARFLDEPAAIPELPAGVEFPTPLMASMFGGAVRDEMGAVLIDLERLDEAQEQLTRAEELSPLLFGMLDMSLYAHLGDLRRRQWRLDEAKQYYERSLKGVGSFKILPLPMDNRLDIEARGRLAEIESLRGRLEEALSWNAQALELARKDGDRSREAAVLEDRGDLLLQHDRIDQAESSYEAALRTAQAAKDRHREATALGSLSKIALLRGDHEVAAARLKTSSSILRDLGKAGLKGPTNVQLAGLYLAFAADDHAAPALTRAHEAAREKVHSPPAAAVEPLDEMVRFADLQAFLDTLVAFAKLTQEAGGRPTDRERRAASRAAQSSFSPARLVGNFYLATAALYRGRRAEARSRATAARDVAKLLENGELEGYAQMMLAVVSLKKGKSREGLDGFRGALASLERTAGRMQNDSMLAAFLGSARRQIHSIFIRSWSRQATSKRPSLSPNGRERAPSCRRWAAGGSHRFAPAIPRWSRRPRRCAARSPGGRT